MGISIADNFNIQMKKPLDNRTQYATLSAMKSVVDSTMSEGCFAYCVETDKYYKFLSSNSVDATLGKWREYSSGGGDDENAYHTTDTAETSLADADYFPFYDTSATDKRKTLWSNIKSNLKTYFDTLYNKYTLPTATSSVLGGVKIGENMLIEDGVINPSYLVVANKFNKSDLYSTTEKVVGCWTDGRPIYQKVVTGTIPATKTTNYISVGASVRDFVRMEMMEIASSGNVYQFQRMINGGFNGTVRISCYNNSASSNQNKIGIEQVTDNTAAAGATVYLTIRYTKTSDAANSFKYADENDYSTSEKIIGSWVDGKILYQKTLQTTMPECTVNETTGVITVGISYVSVGANVDYFVSGQLALKSSSNACVLSIPYVPSTQAYQVTALNTWQNGITIPCTRITGFTNTVSSNKNTIRLENAMSGHNGATCYITIKYTKV